MSRKKAAAPTDDVSPAEGAPRRSKSDLTRERLLKAAAKVVARHGYTGASSARIGDEAGVAAGVLYYHFENRSSLLDEILPTMGVQISQLFPHRRIVGAHGRTGFLPSRG